MSFIDGLFIGCGIYIVYQSVVMRKEGVIPEGVMLNKGTVLSNNADIAGFILSMYWKGIMSGLLGILSVNITALEWAAIVGYFSFVAVVVWFIIYLKMAHRKYLHI